MNANDLRKLITDNNSHENEIFDNIVDSLIARAMDELRELYKNGHWARFIGISSLSISIRDCSDDFENIESKLDWFLYGTESLEKDFSDDICSFEEHLRRIANGNDAEIAGQPSERVFLLAPLVKAFERKGFKCYVNAPNYALIANITVSGKTE